MKTYRIGNDINISWNITRNGDNEDFSGKDVKVKLLDKNNDPCTFDYILDGNQIRGVFYGKDQHTVGYYRLLLVENDGKAGMCTLDYVKAFMIVHKYMNAIFDGTDEIDDRIDTESIDLSSNIDAAANGLSAYEIALTQGFQGTVEEWIESLKVKPVIGVDYYTAEEQEIVLEWLYQKMLTNMYSILSQYDIIGTVDCSSNVGFIDFDDNTGIVDASTLTDSSSGTLTDSSTD